MWEGDGGVERPTLGHIKKVPVGSNIAEIWNTILLFGAIKKVVDTNKNIRRAKKRNILLSQPILDPFSLSASAAVFRTMHHTRA